MSRQFIDGNGADSTSATLAYIQAQRQMRIPDLYMVGELEDPNMVQFTNWESPLNWGPWGTFKPTVVSRGKVTSQPGLKVDSMDVVWSARLTAFGTNLSTANQYQKSLSGFYDSKTFRLWRGVMPNPGDLQTYGACEWFGGRIAEVETSRGRIKFTVSSFLDVVNQQVPPNVIESSNALSSFAGNVPVLADLEKNIPVFTVVAPSNTNNILGDCVSPNAHKIYSPGKFKNGFMVFLAGSSLAGYWSPIGANQLLHIGGHDYNQFITYLSFPWAPTPGDQFYVSTQWPVSLQEAQALGAIFLGFPYVPDPTAGI